jgi:hypothetical protein
MGSKKKKKKGLLDQTFSSDLLPASVKNRQAIICTKAVDPEHTPYAIDVLDSILSKYKYSGPIATGIVQIVRAWRTDSDKGAAFIPSLPLTTTFPLWKTTLRPEVTLPSPVCPSRVLEL